MGNLAPNEKKKTGKGWGKKVITPSVHAKCD